jgi:hypothetical protein
MQVPSVIGHYIGLTQKIDKMIRMAFHIINFGEKMKKSGMLS